MAQLFFNRGKNDSPWGKGEPCNCSLQFTRTSKSRINQKKNCTTRADLPPPIKQGIGKGSPLAIPFFTAGLKRGGAPVSYPRAVKAGAAGGLGLQAYPRGPGSAGDPGDPRTRPGSSCLRLIPKKRFPPPVPTGPSRCTAGNARLFSLVK